MLVPLGGVLAGAIRTQAVGDVLGVGIVPAVEATKLDDTASDERTTVAVVLAARASE